MHKLIMDRIIDEFRTGQCLRDVERYWQFRSTVPGPGLRAASHFLAEKHRAHGLETEMTAYPADDRTEWLDGHRMDLEWTPRSARLSVLRPHSEPICCLADEPLCLISNSTGTLPGGIDAEVIMVHGGASAADYGGRDVAGKIIFTDAFWDADGYAREHGAAGLIGDCVAPPWMPGSREPGDVPDLVQWRTFNGRRGQKPLWGFMLSPRQGQRLRQIIQNSPEPAILHAEVDAELKEGWAEFVTARLPGTDLAHEEIWVTAHSSEPGARDNASGCALSLELGRTLKALVDSGRLPPLRRSIRFLHATEVCGFLPYYDARRNDLERVRAGVNLDSVGQSFSLCGGECVLVRSPETNASFVDGLLAELFAAVGPLPNRRFSRDNFATFPWRATAFRGDDACISDGFFDIPTPAIFTWPDKFYHSSMDKPEQMSDNTMGRIAAIAGTYLYLLATIGPAEASWLAGLTVRDWKRRIIETLTAEPPAAGMPTGRHLGLIAQDALAHLELFTSGDAAHQALDAARKEVLHFATSEAVAGPAGSIPVADGPGDGASVVYRRLRWEHPADGAFSEAGRLKLKALQAGCKVESLWDWINGRRSVQELHERVQRSAAIPAATTRQYLELLVAEGFICRA